MASSNPLKLDFFTLDVFTDTRFLGNPLAVVLVPARLRASITQDVKQRIAREFNLSETVFLHTADSEPEKADTIREVDIFTTEMELPFAGHPTIGTAFLMRKYLKWLHVTTIGTKAGLIRFSGEDGVIAEIPHDLHVHTQTLRKVFEAQYAEAKKLIESALSDNPVIREAELDGIPVSIVKGMTFVLVELPSLDLLAVVDKAGRLDFGAVSGLLDDGDWGRGFTSRYYFVRTATSEAGVRGSGSEMQVVALRTRMVELGAEDPATGSAASTLAGYLALKEKKRGGTKFEITQGVEMGRKSDIVVDTVAAEDGDQGEVRIEKVYLGGKAVVTMNGSLCV